MDASCTTPLTALEGTVDAALAVALEDAEALVGGFAFASFAFFCAPPHATIAPVVTTTHITITHADDTPVTPQYSATLSSPVANASDDVATSRSMIACKWL